MNVYQTESYYPIYDKKYQDVRFRPCIDGSSTSRSKCIGYCEFPDHPGFLTERLRVQHECEEIGCVYYQPKPPKPPRDKVQRIVIETRHNEVMELAVAETAKLEGLKVMGVSEEQSGVWQISYIAIANYSLDTIKKRMEDKIGEKIVFCVLPYQYDAAVAVIFGDLQSEN